MKPKPDFGVEKYLEKPGHLREKTNRLIEMAAGFLDDPAMKDMDTKAREILDQYHAVSKVYIRGKCSLQALEDLVGENTKRLIELFRTAKWQWMTRNDSSMRELYERGQKLESLGTAMKLFTQYSTDEAMLNIEMNKTPEQIESERYCIDCGYNDLRNFVFSWIVSAYQLEDEEYGQLEEMFDSEFVDVYTKRLLVAAVMLSAIEFYEDRKLSLLYKLYQNHSDLVVRQRALVAVIMVGLKHPYSPQLGTIVSDMAKDKPTCLAIFDIQKVVQMSETVDSDGHKALGTMLKGVFSSTAKELTDQLNEEGFLDEEIQVPESLEQECKSDFEGMLDLQSEGTDIYFCQFKYMKKLPFYQSVYNWFMPYYYENSALASVRERLKPKEDFFKVLPYVSNLCDSDVYTMALSSAMDPEGEDFAEIEKLPFFDEEAEDGEDYDIYGYGGDSDDEGQEGFAHVDNEDGVNEALRRKYQEVFDPNRKLSDSERKQEEMECRHKFIHDLYRFYVLSPMKGSLFNPFEANSEMPFVCQDCCKDGIFEKMRIALGRFGILRLDAGFAYKVLPKNQNPVSNTNEMRAAACCSLGKYDEAISIINDYCHGGGKPEVYLRMALECYGAMDSPKLIDILHQLQKIEKDREQLLKYKLKELDFYLTHEMEKEALALAYTLDNEYRMNEKVECRLAEALMFSKPYQKKNLRLAADLVEPHLDGFRQQFQRMGLEYNPEASGDSEETRKKMTALFSIMLKQLSGEIDRAWQCYKDRIHGICTWILDGRAEAEDELIGSCQFTERSKIDVFRFKDRELDLLHSFGISQEEVYGMSERIMDPILQLRKNYGRKQQE